MIGEFKIANTSVLVGQMTTDICREFNVSYIRMREDLPVNKQKWLSNPPSREIKAGYYLKISGDYDNVVKLMKIASGE